MIGIPVGSVLTKVRFEVATWHGYGDQFDDHLAAVNAALDQWAATESDLTINPPAVTERWVMRAPDGLVHDVPIRTTTAWETSTTGVVGAEARRQALERIRQSQQTLAAAGS